MAQEQFDSTPLINDLSTRLRDMEERHNMLKEKALLLGQSFLKQEEEFRKDIAVMRDEIREIRMDTDRMKEGLEHMIQESGNFARKEELRILEKYMKLWEPLKFVKEDEVRRIIREELRK